MIFDSRWTAYR